MKITFLSDTHNKHRQCTNDLPGGDLLIHAGDISSMGYEHEIREFCKWFSSIPGYTHKVFIAGNHDWGFQDNVNKITEILNFYNEFVYIQDSEYIITDNDSQLKIYGSPWQPEFHNWAFNLPRSGHQLQNILNAIPDDTDILITHGPALGYLDTSGPPYSIPRLGCELLAKRIEEIKPKIHVCGHIHGGYGYKFNGDTHFINASVLNEKYVYTDKPISCEWNSIDNTINFNHIE